MGERSPEGGQFMNMGVKEALGSGRVGFEEISVQATEELFQNAPQGQEFIVPDDRYVAAYSGRAEANGRKDIKFKVETTK